MFYNKSIEQKAVPCKKWMNDDKLGMKDFIFKEEIGRGAYGVVYKVICKRDG